MLIHHHFISREENLTGRKSTKAHLLKKRQFRIIPSSFELPRDRTECHTTNLPQLTKMPRPRRRRPRTIIKQCNLPEAHPGMQSRYVHVMLININGTLFHHDRPGLNLAGSKDVDEFFELLLGARSEEGRGCWR